METLEKQSEIVTEPSEIVTKPSVEEPKKPLPRLEGKELVDDPFNLK